MDLPDGRRLGWLELGDPDAWPTFGFHGTPGSRLQFALPDALQPAGVRLIFPDRPGYGLSTYQSGRRLTDWPGDVAQLADHLGVAEFSVFGVSGGGPHSAACAAVLGDRVAAAAIVSGVGPLSHPDATEGMMPANRVVTVLARRRSRLLRGVMRLQVAGLHRWPEQSLKMMTKQLPPADVAILERPEIRSLFLDDARNISRDAGRACAQDFELFVADWGSTSARSRCRCTSGRGTPTATCRLDTAGFSTTRSPARFSTSAQGRDTSWASIGSRRSLRRSPQRSPPARRPDR